VRPSRCAKIFPPTLKGVRPSVACFFLSSSNVIHHINLHQAGECLLPSVLSLEHYPALSLHLNRFFRRLKPPGWIPSRRVRIIRNLPFDSLFQRFVRHFYDFCNSCHFINRNNHQKLNINTPVVEKNAFIPGLHESEIFEVSRNCASLFLGFDIAPHPF